MRRKSAVVLLLLGIVAIVAVARSRGGRPLGAIREQQADMTRLRAWVRDPQAYPDRWVPGGRRCGDALMVVPSAGYVGFTRGDSFRPGHEHSGLDIFSPDGELDMTPVVAAYDGYLTREADWKSTVILRHPDMPAMAGVMRGETLWTYYTHMASIDGEHSFVSADFPPGTREEFVAEGTLLGRQGRWSGDPDNPTGLHLHFSIVRSTLDGSYADETRLENTLDPIHFLGLVEDEDGVVRCRVEDAP